MDKTRFTPWLACFSAALFFFYQFLQLTSLNTIGPELAQTLELNKTQLGELASWYLYGLALFCIPAGLLLDHFSARRIMLGSLAIAIGCTVLFSQTDSFLVLKLSRFIAGIVNSTAFLGCCFMAARWLFARIALVIGCIATIGLLGGACSQVPLLLLVVQLGWRNSLLALASLGILIWIIMWFWLKNPPNHPTTGFKGLSFSPVLQMLKIIVRDKFNWIPAIYTCLMNLPIIVLGAVWGMVYLTHEHQLDALQSTQVISMIYFGTILGCPLVGLLSDRIRNRKIPMILGAIIALVIALVILFTQGLNVTALTLLFLLLGFVTSTQVLTYPVLTERNSQEMSTTVLGFASIIIMGGGGLFQLLFGWIVEVKPQLITAWLHLNGYQLAFGILPIAFLLCIALAGLIPKITDSHF